MWTRRTKARSLAPAHAHTHERTYDHSSNVVSWKMKMTLKFMHIWEKLTSGGETNSNDDSFRNSNKIYITLNFSQKLIKQFVDHFFWRYIYIFISWLYRIWRCGWTFWLVRLFHMKLIFFSLSYTTHFSPFVFGMNFRLIFFSLEFGMQLNPKE